jgi:hypothetical protein
MPFYGDRYDSYDTPWPGEPGLADTGLTDRVTHLVFVDGGFRPLDRARIGLPLAAVPASAWCGCATRRWRRRSPAPREFYRAR